MGKSTDDLYSIIFKPAEQVFAYINSALGDNVNNDRALYLHSEFTFYKVMFLLAHSDKKKRKNALKEIDRHLKDENITKNIDLNMVENYLKWHGEHDEDKEIREESLKILGRLERIIRQKV